MSRLRNKTITARNRSQKRTLRAPGRSARRETAGKSRDSRRGDTSGRRFRVDILFASETRAPRALYLRDKLLDQPSRCFSDALGFCLRPTTADRGLRTLPRSPINLALHSFRDSFHSGTIDLREQSSIVLDQRLRPSFNDPGPSKRFSMFRFSATTFSLAFHYLRHGLTFLLPAIHRIQVTVLSTG